MLSHASKVAPSGELHGTQRSARRHPSTPQNQNKVAELESRQPPPCNLMSMLGSFRVAKHKKVGCLYATSLRGAAARGGAAPAAHRARALRTTTLDHAKFLSEQAVDEPVKANDRSLEVGLACSTALAAGTAKIRRGERASACRLPAVDEPATSTSSAASATSGRPGGQASCWSRTLTLHAAGRQDRPGPQPGRAQGAGRAHPSSRACRLVTATRANRPEPAPTVPNSPPPPTPPPHPRRALRPTW
jgi:hypothetical protein